MTQRSVEAEHLSNWLYADRVTRYVLLPALVGALLVARSQFGLPYPFRICLVLFLSFFLYNKLVARFLKRRHHTVSDTTIYFIALMFDAVLVAAVIHYTGGIESVLAPLTAVIAMLGALFLTFSQCLCVSLFAAWTYVLVLRLESLGLLPHYHIFPALSPTLHTDQLYVTLMAFGVSVVLGTLGLIAGYLAAGRRRHSERLGAMQLRLEEWNRDLRLHVEARTRNLRAMHEQLKQAYLQTVTAFMQALGAKDLYTQGHSHAVSTYARLIGEEMGLDEHDLQSVVRGCELHDIGKIAVPDQILLKKGPLTQEEFEIIKQHPVWGAKILEPLTFMKDVTEIVRQEHERWDGRGYPAGLKGEEICLGARITAVADAWDAMTSARPYRKPLPRDIAIEEIRQGAGSQFDPMVVEAFLRVVEKGRLPVAEPPVNGPTPRYPHGHSHHGPAEAESL